MTDTRSFRRFAAGLTTGLALTAAGLALSTAGCEEYDAPPDVRLIQPPGGSYTVGEPLQLRFTEAIDPETLTVRVWPTTRGTRRTPLTEVEPLAGRCATKYSPCDDVELAVDEDRLAADVLLGGELARPGVPMVLEVTEGLSDESGNTTGVSRFFDFQFVPGGACGSGEDVEFDDGIYILGATVNQPMAAVLTLVTAIQVLPDGRLALAGADGEVLGDAPKTTRDPAQIEVNDTPAGWSVFASGCINVLDDGRRLLETEPIDVTVPVLNLVIKLHNMRLQATVSKSEETGKDRIDGTLSYEGLTIVRGNKEVDYPGASTALLADYVAPDATPAGHPEICGNLCGAIIGLCDPPEDFPGEGFCED